MNDLFFAIGLLCCFCCACFGYMIGNGIEGNLKFLFSNQQNELITARKTAQLWKDKYIDLLIEVEGEEAVKTFETFEGDIVRLPVGIETQRFVVKEDE